MILSGWRVLRSLAWYHHVMIVITILVPLGWSVVITLWAPDCRLLLVAIHVAAFLTLFLLAEFAVGLALRRDKAKAENFVSEEIEALSGEVRVLEEQHGALIASQERVMEGLRTRINDHDEDIRSIRSALERLGETLPPRNVSVSFSAKSGGVQVSIAAVAEPVGGRRTRVLRLFRRCARWLKEKVWGKPDHR